VNRRKKHQEHENHERWLVSYADFITLLFAFFVVLYSSSYMDNKKIARLSVAIEGGFQELGAFGNGVGPGGAQASAQWKAQGSPVPPTAASPPASAKPAAFSGGIDIALLRHELEQALGDEIKKQEIQVRITPEGLIVSLREIGFFKSGDAHLLPDAVPKLSRIAHILLEHGYEVRVEGHTDDVPIHSPQFQSNWELSTARATEVLMILIDRYHYDPGKLSIAGYSQFRPVADNSTAEGRKMNRRVDLVIVSQIARTADSAENAVAQAAENETDQAGK